MNIQITNVVSHDDEADKQVARGFIVIFSRD